MQDILIPGWAALVFGVILIPWMVWLTIQTVENRQSIAVNTNNDAKVSGDLEKIYKSIDKLDAKLDLFLANEMTMLKQALSKG